MRGGGERGSLSGRVSGSMLKMAFAATVIVMVMGIGCFERVQGAPVVDIVSMSDKEVAEMMNVEPKVAQDDEGSMRLSTNDMERMSDESSVYVNEMNKFSVSTPSLALTESTLNLAAEAAEAVAAAATKKAGGGKVDLGGSGDSETLPAQGVRSETLTQVTSGESKEMIDLIVVIPTVRRFKSDGTLAPDTYLKTMINKMWDDMSTDERMHVQFYILNSDKEPEKHVEATALQNHPHVTVYTKLLHQSEFDPDGPQLLLEDGRSVSQDWMKWVASENLDAAFLFEQAARRAPYILFLEDDVLPTSNALRKLSDFVHDFAYDDWFFLDLYTPNLDWNDRMLKVENGKPYAFQCCTQAMLFRSHMVSGVIDYWREHSHEPIDDNLRMFRENHAPDLQIYAVRPNLFEHVGAYSSNKEKSTGTVEHTSLDFIP